MLNPKFEVLNSRRHGFTLIEIMLIIGILGVISALGFMSLLNFKTSADLDAASRNAADILRRAQSNAVTGENFTTWGVHFESSTNSFMQLFSGSTYAGGTKYEYLPLSKGLYFSNPAPGAAVGDTVKIEISGNGDISTSDGSTVSGAPAAITGTTTLQ